MKQKRMAGLPRDPASVRYIKLGAGGLWEKECTEKGTIRIDRMFYVHHAGTPKPPEDSRVVLIGPDRLAEMVMDAGLYQWLIEKVS